MILSGQEDYLSMTLKERYEHRRRVLADYHANTLTQEAFCKDRGVALSTLQYWLKRERESGAEKRKTGFVKVPEASLVATETSHPIRILIGERIIIEVGPNASSQQLAVIFQAAESL